MLDDDDAVPGIHQPVQHANQLVHIGHVQAHRGLVEHIEGVRGFLAAFAHLVAHFGEFGDQLDALGLAARQGGRRLAQSEVAQAHIFE